MTQIGMPFFMGCCCVNMCAARNLIRYQYRISGDDFIEELVIPCGIQCLGKTLGQCIPCIWCAWYAFYVTVGMHLMEEIKLREANSASVSSTSSTGMLNADPQAVFSEVVAYGIDAADSVRYSPIYSADPCENSSTRSLSYLAPNSQQMTREQERGTIEMNPLSTSHVSTQSSSTRGDSKPVVCGIPVNFNSSSDSSSVNYNPDAQQMQQQFHHFNNNNNNDNNGSSY